MLDRNESFFPELLANLSKFSIPEILSRAQSNKNNEELTQDPGNYLLSLLDPTKRMAEKSTDLLLDYFTFQSRQDSVNKCMPQGTVVPGNRNQAINETLMNCLQLDGSGDFNLDAFNVKLSSLVCKSIEWGLLCWNPSLDLKWFGSWKLQSFCALRVLDPMQSREPLINLI